MIGKISLLLIWIFVAINFTVGQSSKMDWFRDNKFGLFLHWGLYSQTAGDWNGRPTKGGEHFMLYEKIPLKVYATIADDFNPAKFNAEQWVLTAKNAGMRYIVITAKHHDGFSMYNSAASDYNIVQKTPWGKDPILLLAEACKKHDMKLCFYYSLGRDWEDPDVPTNWPVKAGRSNTWDYPDEDAKDLSKYIERKVKPQLRELLTQYGPIGVIWFDTPELVTKKQSQEIRDLILSLQPDCIINGRIGNGMGDYSVVEQSLVSKARQNWEACITMSANWGYNRHDTAWKSPELLVRHLVEVVSKGGNLLLNVGPKGDGSWPKEATANLEAIGKWMEVNKEALYGTVPWVVNGEGNEELKEEDLGKGEKSTLKDAVSDATPADTPQDIRFTAKGDSVVYVFVRSPVSKTIDVRSLMSTNGRVLSIDLLGSPKKVKWAQDADKLRIDLAEDVITDVPVYVYQVNLQL